MARDPAEVDEEAPGRGKESPKRRTALSQLRRELSDEELKTPAVQKLIADELDRLDLELMELRKVEARYHEVDKELAVAKSKLRFATAFEILVGVSFTMGGAFLGFAPALWSTPPYGYLAAIVGVLMVIAGGAAKLVEK